MNNAVPVANPSALSAVRFLITQRIEDLDAVARQMTEWQEEATRKRDDLRDRVEEAEIAWAHVLKKMDRFKSEDIDSQFRVVASTHADLAAIEERVKDLDIRLGDLRHEQDVLRSLFRGLDDLIAGVSESRIAPSAKLRDTSRQVFQIIEEERMRIARDMHDGPAQSMANLVLQAEILERLMERDPQLVVNELADFKHGVRTVLDETRRLIFDLRPMTLDDLGLVPTLRKFIRDFADKFGIKTQLRVNGEEMRLPGTLEPTMFRIIQEALNNAKKHAEAKNVEVVITFQPHLITAKIRDDGVGFDVEAAEAGLESGRHLGMISMRERTELEKGNIEIRSEPGKGAEVSVSFEF